MSRAEEPPPGAEGVDPSQPAELESAEAGTAEGQVDAEALGRTVELLGMSLTSRRGPLPDPNEMAGFKRVQPDLPERITRQWERETEHRQELERQIVGANIKNRSRGQIIGAFLATIVIVGGIVLIALDKEVAGLATLLSAVGVLVGRFVVHELWSGRRERP